MPTALAEEAVGVLGPVLTQVYGSCEAPHPVTVLSNYDHLPGRNASMGSVGHEAFGVEVRIVSSAGQDVGLGDAGELWIRGPNVMSGYWDDLGATDQVFQDGWYRSGDVAQRNDEGFVFIVGREREMLISGGLNVYPAEVEGVLHTHPSVSEAAVFGIPDELWGEAVTAAIVLRSDHFEDEREILRHCAEHLADYKKPRWIIFVDHLPKGTTGKVSKSELRAIASARVDEHSSPKGLP